MEGVEKRAAIFDEVWGMRDRGEIDDATAHRMLGRYFGYPECCIEAFIDAYPYTERGTGSVVDCTKYGTYYRCWACTRGLT